MPVLALLGLVIAIVGLLGLLGVLAIGTPASIILLVVGLIMVVADPGVRSRF